MAEEKFVGLSERIAKLGRLSAPLQISPSPPRSSPLPKVVTQPAPQLRVAPVAPRQPQYQPQLQVSQVGGKVSKKEENNDGLMSKQTRNILIGVGVIGAIGIISFVVYKIVRHFQEEKKQRAAFDQERRRRELEAKARPKPQDDWLPDIGPTPASPSSQTPQPQSEPKPNHNPKPKPSDYTLPPASPPPSSDPNLVPIE